MCKLSVQSEAAGLKVDKVLVFVMLIAFIELRHSFARKPQILAAWPPKNQMHTTLPCHATPHLCFAATLLYVRLYPALTPLPGALLHAPALCSHCHGPDIIALAFPIKSPPPHNWLFFFHWNSSVIHKIQVSAQGL